MSDEYKDRYIIITLLKTPLGTTDNIENTVSPNTELKLDGGSSSDIIKDLPNR